MKHWQYLELCRLAIAEQYQIDLKQVRRRRVLNPVRQGQRRYRHDIDLLWVTENPLARYVHVASVFWRKSGPVELEEVLLLQKRKEKIAAHKAILITNFCYSLAALAAAADEGIGLFNITPLFEPALVENVWPRQRFQEKLQQLSRKMKCLYWFASSLDERGASLLQKGRTP